MNDPLPEDRRTANTLRTLAAADPDYLTFVEQHPDLSRASVSPTVEAELAREMLTLLQQLPDRSAQLERLKKTDARSTFDGGIATVPILLAAAFLLRTHLRIKRSSAGKWEFGVEHKPADNKLVTQLLTKIAKLLSTG